MDWRVARSTDSFSLYLLGRCHNCLPKFLFEGVMPATLKDLPFKDAPKVHNWIEVRVYGVFFWLYIPIAAKDSVVLHRLA